MSIENDLGKNGGLNRCPMDVYIYKSHHHGMVIVLFS